MSTPTTYGLHRPRKWVQILTYGDQNSKLRRELDGMGKVAVATNCPSGLYRHNRLAPRIATLQSCRWPINPMLVTGYAWSTQALTPQIPTSQVREV